MDWFYYIIITLFAISNTAEVDRLTPIFSAYSLERDKIGF